MMNVATNKHDKIMEAALDLFAERGFDATTVPMIAEKAEVGAGTIYRYFDNKESLLNALYQQCVKQFSDTLRRGYLDTASSREQFRCVFFNMAQFARNNIQAFYFIETHNHTHCLDATSRELFNQLMKFLRAFFDQGKHQNLIRPLPSDALIAIIYGAFVSLFKMIRRGEMVETPELLADVEASCWDAVRIHLT